MPKPYSLKPCRIFQHVLLPHLLSMMDRIAEEFKPDNSFEDDNWDEFSQKVIESSFDTFRKYFIPNNITVDDCDNFAAILESYRSYASSVTDIPKFLVDNVVPIVEYLLNRQESLAHATCLIARILDVTAHTDGLTDYILPTQYGKITKFMMDGFRKNIDSYPGAIAYFYTQGYLESQPGNLNYPLYRMLMQDNLMERAAKQFEIILSKPKKKDKQSNEEFGIEQIIIGMSMDNPMTFASLYKIANSDGLPPMHKSGFCRPGLIRPACILA